MKSLLLGVLIGLSNSSFAQTLARSDLPAGKSIAAKVLDQSNNDITSQYSLSYPGPEIKIISFAGKPVIIGQLSGSYTITATKKTDSSIVNLPVKVTPGQASFISILDGNFQSALSGSSLNTPLRVKITDSFSNPVAGVKVSFAVSKGSSQISLLSTQSDSDGISSGNLTLGSIAEKNTIISSANIGGAPKSVSFYAVSTYVIGKATQLSIVAQPSTVTAGAPFSISFSSLSQPGLVSDSFSGTVSISGFQNSTCIIPTAVPLTGTTSVNSLNGIAFFSDIQAQKGLFYIKATAYGLSPTCSSPIESIVPALGPTSLKITQMPTFLKATLNFFPAVKVAELNSSGKVMESGAETIQLNSYDDSECLQLSTEQISNNSSVATSGHSTFSKSQSVTARTIYIKAISGLANSSCSSALTILAAPAIIPKCSTTKHIESGACVLNVKKCPISNGVGSSLYSAGGWGGCSVSSCLSKFELSEDKKNCVGSFNPPSMDGLDIWLTDRPSSLNFGKTTGNGDKVYNWGLFNASNPGLAPKLINNSFNGYDLLDFSAATGGGSLSFNDYSNTTGAYSITIAFVSPAYSWGNALSTNGSSLSIGLEYGHIGAYTNGFLVSIYDPNTAPDGSLAFVTVVADPVAQTISLYYNGHGSSSVVTSGYSKESGLSILNGLIIGADDPKVAEVLTYNKAISTSQVQDLHRYLNNKYFNPLYAKGSLQSIFGGCVTGTHLNSGGTCDRDIVDCSIVGSSAANKAWTGTAYSSCSAISCIEGFDFDPASRSCNPNILPTNGLVMHINVSSLKNSGLIDGSILNSWDDASSGASFVSISGAKPHYSAASPTWNNQPVVVFPTGAFLSWTPPPSAKVDKNFTLVAAYGNDYSAWQNCMEWFTSIGKGISIGGGTGVSSVYPDGRLIGIGINQGPPDYRAPSFVEITSEYSPNSAGIDVGFGVFGFLEGKDFGIPWFRSPNDWSHKADGTPTVPIVPAVSLAGFPIIIGPNTGVCSFSEMMLYNRPLTLDEVKQVSSYMVKENGIGILQGL